MTCKKERYVFESKDQYLKARNFKQIIIILWCSVTLSTLIVSIAILINKPNLPDLPFPNYFIWAIIILLWGLGWIKIFPEDNKFEHSVCYNCTLFSTKYCPFNTMSCDYKTTKHILNYKGKVYDDYGK